MFKKLKHKIKVVLELRSSYPLLTDLIKEHTDKLKLLRQLKKDNIELY